MSLGHRSIRTQKCWKRSLPAGRLRSNIVAVTRRRKVKEYGNCVVYEWIADVKKGFWTYFWYRNKRQRGSMQSLSAVTAALQSEDEESDGDDDAADEQVDDEDTDNPRWQLYNAVRTYTNSQGTFLHSWKSVCVNLIECLLDSRSLYSGTFSKAAVQTICSHILEGSSKSYVHISNS